jgi:hypothetical protein
MCVVTKISVQRYVFLPVLPESKIKVINNKEKMLEKFVAVIIQGDSKLCKYLRRLLGRSF